MTLYKWARLPDANALADASVNWQENQAPSSVNDSARGMMAAMAKYRDDTAGAILTSGTSTTYAVATYEAFTTLAQLNGQVVAFTPHTTNGATVTLNVDGLGAKPLRQAPSTELLAGTLIQGTPYIAIYNNSDQAFYLHGFYGNAYNIPLGGAMIYFGPTAPNSAYVFPFGQSISRTTYAALFGLFGTTYGNGLGDGLTFSLPDLRGRVLAGRDDMGGSAASRLTSSHFGTSAAALGATGGSESNTLTLAQLPGGIASSGNNSISVTSAVQFQQSAGGPTVNAGGSTSVTSPNPATVTSTGSNSISVVSNNTAASGNGVGAAAAHRLVQPTIICNYILRVI